MIPESRLPELAFDTIEEVLDQNLGKHGTDAYLSYTQDCHLDKALRHAITYRLTRDGNVHASNESHLKHAIVRLVMALALENYMPNAQTPKASTHERATHSLAHAEEWFVAEFARVHNYILSDVHAVEAVAKDLLEKLAAKI